MNDITVRYFMCPHCSNKDIKIKELETKLKVYEEIVNQLTPTQQKVAFMAAGSVLLSKVKDE